MLDLAHCPILVTALVWGLFFSLVLSKGLRIRPVDGWNDSGLPAFPVIKSVSSRIERVALHF